MYIEHRSAREDWSARGDFVNAVTEQSLSLSLSPNALVTGHGWCNYSQLYAVGCGSRATVMCMYPALPMDRSVYMYIHVAIEVVKKVQFLSAFLPGFSF